MFEENTWDIHFGFHRVGIKVGLLVDKKKFIIDVNNMGKYDKFKRMLFIAGIDITPNRFVYITSLKQMEKFLDILNFVYPTLWYWNKNKYMRFFK